MYRYRKIFIVLILVVGFFFRFYKLSQVPGSLNWDEASWGYNGYSILKTGRDEHGVFLPLSFEAFGDYKQPVYVYLSAISIGIFGLSEFAVRFPSAVLGSLSILLTYLLVFELFKKIHNVGKIALMASLFFAISPWSIQFSRVAYEANAGLFFVILGVWLFLKGLNRKKWKYLFIASIPLAVSAYTYHSQKIFTPILFIGLLIFGFTFLKKQKKNLVLLVVFFIFLNIPWLIDSRTTTRGRSVTIFANKTEILKQPVQRLIYDKEKNDKLGAIFHNRRAVYAGKYIENYLAHFSPTFLFISGEENPRHHPPQMGVLYLLSLPLILIGILYLVRNKNSPVLFLFFWYFIAPGPAALAMEAPNASRSLIFLPTWQIFEAFGLYYLLGSLKKIKYGRFLKYLIIFFLIGNIVYYLHMYFIHTNTDTQIDWQYGYKQAVEYVNSSDRRAYFASNVEQGYIFYLFYSGIDPHEYIKKGGSSRTNKDCYLINKAYFGACNNNIQDGDIFITTLPLSLKKEYRLMHTTTYFNGEEAVYIYERTGKKKLWTR